MNNLFFSLFFSLSFLFSHDIKTSQKPSVSIVIPCISSHVKFLSSLLMDIENQTLVPNEVVVSVSQVTNNTLEELETLKQIDWSYKLLLITTPTRKFAGENRNIAISNSSGELIICQDADDLPHPERVEIIYNTYLKTKFDVLIHYFSKHNWTEEKFSDFKKIYDEYTFLDKPFKTERIDIAILKKYSTIPVFRLLGSPLFEQGLHYGNIAFHRSVFQSIQYSDKRNGQDANFTTASIKLFKNNIMVHLPLVYYAVRRGTLIERNL